MSCTQYLNELETERRAIEAEKPQTASELSAWWERLGEWWRRRDLGFGDGSGMSSHCFAMSRKYASRSLISEALDE